MVEKIKSVLAWIHVTFLSSSVEQIRYVPIKITFSELQKEFYDFFVTGGKVKGYDFSSSKGRFSIQENRDNELFNFATSSTYDNPLTSYEVSETDNEYLLKLEVGYRYDAGFHLIVRIVKWVFFIAAILFLFVGLYLLITSSLESKHYPIFIFPVGVLLLLGVFAISSTIAIARANSRLLIAIEKFESGEKIKRF